MLKNNLHPAASLKKNSRLVSAAEKLGIHDTYIFDDLVFEKNNAFLLCKGTNGDEIFLYCNEDSREAQRDAIVSKVIIAGEYRGLRIKMAGLYSVHSNNEHEIDVEFRE
jgi:hypothetical protein